jgi:V/A-type H+-transporting ATPase subunit B
VSSQLFAAYSRVKQVRNLASIIGEEELSEGDKCYLKFGEQFEQVFLTQGENENRDIGRTLDLGWKVLAELPREELLRVKQEYIEKYMNANTEK